MTSVTPICFGCSSGLLRRGECIHAGGRSRRPTLASTLHNRHGSARFDAQKSMPARQPLEMPGRYRFHSTRSAPWKRVGVASSVDRQSQGGVNFRHTTRQCFSLWLPRSGKAWEDRRAVAPVLVALWLYATVEGWVRARELERLAQSDAAYRWLAEACR